MKKTAPFGTWPSPINAELLTAKNQTQSYPRFFDGVLYWLESRPDQQGRTALVRESSQGPKTVTPDGVDVRTRAQEYGGICYTVGDGYVFFVDNSTQQIFQLSLPLSIQNGAQLGAPNAITPEGPAKYADLIYDSHRKRIVCVEELDEPDAIEPITRLVSFSVDKPIERVVIAEGDDFYAHPRLSPCGNQLLWLSWNHPDMPWDNTNLWRAHLNESSTPLSIKSLIENRESVFQPEWSPSGEIYYVSDRNNWWQLYRHNDSNNEVVFEPNRDCGLPLWQFGMTTWGFLSPTSLVVTHCLGGEWQLSEVNLNNGEAKSHDLLPEATGMPLNYLGNIATDPKNNTSAFIGASPTLAQQLFLLDHDDNSPKLRQPAETPNLSFTEKGLASPTAIEFSISDGKRAHGYFYTPVNATYEGPKDQKPPLIVICHGGPTASTSAAFNIKVQFWTSRGFAVFDVNYRGSTGYGRNYRNQLQGNWGLYDAEDACAAARYAVNQNLCHPEQLIIRGSSAGGYTVLSALCFHDTFAAGCSLYGIGDLTALADCTHKFESRYTDSLVAPITEKKIYHDRSPLQNIDGFNCPVIFLQGLQDKVVPPSQAESMVSALDKKNIPVAYVNFPNEGHGFRDSANMIKALNSELAFYGEIFGFQTDSSVTDLHIHNRKNN